MKEQIKFMVKFHSNSLIGSLVLELAFGLVGVAVSLLVIFSEDAVTEWICGASLMAVVGLTFISVFSTISYQQGFMQALSMGRTRKEFMTCYALYAIVWVVLGYALVLVIYGVEQSLYPQMFSLPESAEVTRFWVDWRFILGYIISVVVLSMFVGALIGRFGKKCTLVLYFLWVGLCMSTGRIIDMMEAALSGSGPLAWVFAVPAAVWIGLGAAALAAMVSGIWRMGMKQMVR